MNEKSTQELENVLGSTHISNYNAYCEEHKESMKMGKDDFIIYMKKLFQEKRLTQW